MLLVAKRRRMAVHVALIPLATSLAVGAAAARAIATEPTGAALVAALLAAALFAYVMATIRLLRGRAHTVVVRSLLTTMTFDARAAAFGVAAAYRPRAVYTVYITDGMRRSDVGAYSSRRALAGAGRLTEAFAVANRGGSAEARGLVAREIAAWQAKEAEAARQRRAYLATSAWKAIPLLLGLGVGLYFAVQSLLTYLHR